MATAVDSKYRRLAEAYPLVDVAPEARFSEDGVLDKLTGLVGIVIATGVVGAFFLPRGLALVSVIVALGFALAGTFKPQWAKVCAPAYAVFEGLALGAISAIYADFGGGIVPMAILFTGATFLGCLAAFRTGLVKVTPRFLMITMVATLGLVVVSLLSMIGLPIPGVNELGTRGLLFGIFGLGVGVLNLFVSFEQVAQMERQGAAKDGEWYGALQLLTSLVLVYIYALRTIAAARR